MLSPKLSPEPSSFAFSPSPSSLFSSDFLNDKVDWDKFVHLDDENEDPSHASYTEPQKISYHSTYTQSHPATPPEDSPPLLSDFLSAKSLCKSNSDTALPDCADPAQLIIIPQTQTKSPPATPEDTKRSSKSTAPLNPFFPSKTTPGSAPPYIDMLGLPPPPPPPGWPGVPPNPEMYYYYALCYAQYQQQLAQQSAFFGQPMPLPIPMPIMPPDAIKIDPKVAESLELLKLGPLANLKETTLKTPPSVKKSENAEPVKIENPKTPSSISKRKRTSEPVDLTEPKSTKSGADELSPRALRSLKRQPQGDSSVEKREMPTRTCRKSNENSEGRSKRKSGVDDYIEDSDGDELESEISDDEESEVSGSDVSDVEIEDSVALAVKRRRSTNSNKTDVDCKKCGEEFTRITDLAAHCRIRHKTTSLTKRQRDKAASSTK